MNTLFRALLVAVLCAAGCGDGTSDGTITGAQTTGAACVTDTDCATGQQCQYPVADGCAAKGSCVTPAAPTGPRCNSILLMCGCDGSRVAVPCDQSNVAPKPVKGGIC